MFGIDKDAIKAAFARFNENLPLAQDDSAKIALIVQFIQDLEKTIS